MYIIDGIAYAGEPARPVKVVSACPLDGWRLKLRFSTGEVKIFDFVPLLDLPCFRTLQDESVFRSVSLIMAFPSGWMEKLTLPRKRSGRMESRKTVSVMSSRRGI